MCYCSGTKCALLFEVLHGRRREFSDSMAKFPESCFNINMPSYQYRVSIIKIRRSYDNLISYWKSPYLEWRCLYWKEALNTSQNPVKHNTANVSIKTNCTPQSVGIILVMGSAIVTPSPIGWSHAQSDFSSVLHLKEETYCCSPKWQHWLHLSSGRPKFTQPRGCIVN